MIFRSKLVGLLVLTISMTAFAADPTLIFDPDPPVFDPIGKKCCA